YLSGLDKVFGTLESLKWTALFISAISIFAAVLHGLYDKLKLFGTLSILGATRRQIFSTMFASALSLTLSGALVGIFSALSLIPVVLYVINKNAFGWTLRFEFPWIWIPILLISVPLLSFLASIYPYWKIQKESLRNIFHEES
ncbi:MAG: ABC transporter permease, partial [Leptospira sp.]|nr:ABC transporter permease [Leptospira sp.]